MDRNGYILERWMSITLRFGIWLSAVLIAIGLIGVALQQQVVHEMTPLTFSTFASHLRSEPFAPQNFLFSGIVLLCFTPLARVLIACIGFMKENDRRFVSITLIVFLLLLIEIVYALFIP
ncbi:MAG: DUF1634 domain-containing protein [Bacteroidetes bacterium]|nr:DUF1634 domain-containing protein [Bacteroidota bacterium]